MVWPDWKIEKWAKTGGITPYTSEQLNPSSYDLRLGNKVRFPDLIEHKWSEPSIFDVLHLKKGDFVLCHSEEFTSLPSDVVAFLYLKSSAGRKGLEHSHAGFGDAGFKGQWTFELHSVWPGTLTIMAGELLLQIVLVQCLTKPNKMYAGHYQNQIGPTPFYK